MGRIPGVKTSFIRLAERAPGVMYEPEKGAKCTTAILVMHYDEDYLSFEAGPELAKRGYRVLCANTMAKDGIIYSQPEKMQNLANAMNFLRSHGAEKVVFLGHSGGATLGSAYQAAAENGMDVLSGSEKIYPYNECRRDLGLSDDEKFIPTDGMMMLDANWGNSVMTLFSVDPAVLSEKNGHDIDESLNLFNPENGFRPEGSEYPDEFIKRFQAGQSRRFNMLIDKALERLKMINEGRGDYRDDEPFIIPGSAQGFLNNKLFAQDIRLMSHTKEPQSLIHADGSITKEIVYTVRGPENSESFTNDFREGARILTVKSFLNSFAIRTNEKYGFGEDWIDGIEWDSAYNSPLSNVGKISVPMLVMGMTAGWEFAAAESIFNMSASKDKTLAYVEGANHKFKTEKSREEYPGQFGDTIKTLFDYVDKWLEERFM